MPNDPLRTPETAETEAPFPYMRYARAHLMTPDPLSMGLSGASRPAQGEREGVLPPPPPDAPKRYREALAARYGLEPEGIWPTLGSSGANHLVYLALARGGHVLVETPAYQALHALGPLVGARCSTFARPATEGFAPDFAVLEAGLRKDTRLVVLTDLHNPSGRRLADESRERLAHLAEAHDLFVLVDEVYLDFDAQRRPSAATLGPRFVATNSLTKAHGLGDLRAGWIAAAPDVIERIALVDDLVSPMLPYSTMDAAAAYLPHADTCLADTHRRADARARQVDAAFSGHPRARWHAPDGGVTGLLEIEPSNAHPSGEAFAEALLARTGVRVIPGAFFQLPHMVRLSFDLPEADLETCLDAIRQELAR